MFERNYYYLVAGLPDLLLDQKKLTLKLEEFRDEMRNDLHPDDYSFVEMLFLPADNRNLLNLLLKTGKSFDDSGKYTTEELEQELKDPVNTPWYMQDFIVAFKNGVSIIEGLSWEDQLTWLFYDYVKSCRNQFLQEWFEFDMNLKNIVAAINVRKHKLEGDKYFIGDNTIVHALKKSSLKDFGLGNDFEYMEQLINIQENANLLEREKAMDMLRWNFIDEQNTLNYFNLEVLLGYVIKLQMVKRWLEMDKETGMQMFRKLIEDLEGSYEFPEEFTIRDARKNR